MPGIRRPARIAAVAAALPVLVASLLAASPERTAPTTEQQRGPKPTVVLVHGAFADASSWNGVVRRLKRDGFPVVASANPLRGLHSDAAYLKSVLAGIKGPIVLAGHSYGGAVMSIAAAGDPNVKALVYIAAFTPDTGESAGELAAKFPGSTLGEAVQTSAYPLPDGGTGTELTIDQDKYHQQFAHDVPRNEASVLAATQRPVSTAALEEKATAAAWKNIPSWALVATGDKNIPPAAERWMARRAGSHTLEVNASHAVTVSRPDVVSRLILDAYRATR
jgi:pimeloyl-ACP methyl ester carboxylesterase